MRLYGIKNCGSVKKAMSLLNEKGVEYEFIDLKKFEVTKELIDKWLEKTTLTKLLNTRGTKYRTLKLKELNLNDDEKIEWLIKEPLLIKRPVIEYNGEVIVGFDEEELNSL